MSRNSSYDNEHLMLKTSLLVLTMIVNLPACAGSTRSNIDDFDRLVPIFEKWGKPDSSLLVMDNDNTLTMIPCPDNSNPDYCQYLGGPAWFSWQQRQIEKGKEPKVADTFDQLLDVSTVIYAVSDMIYTRPDVPDVLHQLTGTGVRLLVETARGNADLSATERQFGQLNINGSENLLEYISENAVSFDGATSKPSPYIPCQQTAMRPISYRNGVMYLSGQNKGVNLKCMLDEYNNQANVVKITHVVFIDDMEENVKDVHSAFKNSNEYMVHALHYTALREHKKAFIKSELAESYQLKSMQRWNTLLKAMDSQLLDPAVND